MKKIISIIVCTILFQSSVFSQTLTQTAIGVVLDKSTQEPLPGASIILLNNDMVIGTATDAEGKFILEKIPVGRQNFQINMIGYESYIINEIMVSSGKQVVLNISLQQATNELSEVVVRVRKDVPLNTMSTVSARQFTVEETQRYAGGMDDPSRLVSSFAGVATPSVSANGISVRGNKPDGLLWKMEGVEIPNPNHFANLTVAGGGLLTAISSNVMGNSDFHTGAFPAEYGNAVSGVFDIKLKKGNSSKREYSLQAGLVGLDFATEGPFVKGKKSTYLINYRYSTLGLIAPVLPKESGVIKYQDLAFKINIPTQKTGTFSLWGISAIDGNIQPALDSADWEVDFHRDKSNIKYYMFAAGLSHNIQLGAKTFLKSIISESGTKTSLFEERLDYNLNSHDLSDYNNASQKTTFQSALYHRFNNKITSKTGFYYDKLGYNINIKQTFELGLPLATLSDSKGNTDLFQLFTQSNFNITGKLTANVGLHYQYFMLNKNSSTEPRIGFKYTANSKHSFAFAYGLHSRLEMLPVYFTDINGELPNKDLELMKSSHFIFAYNVKLTDQLRLNIEPYFQYLTDVPVSPDSYISTLNFTNNIFFNDILVNEGTARNMGIDITFERFLKNGFYYLATASLFDAKYTGADGIERNTRFNKNYVFNLLAGKEWAVGKSGNNIFGVNFRLNYLGGNRIEAIDYEATAIANEVIYAETPENLSFAKQFKDSPVISFTVSYRKNKSRYSSVWSLQVLNAGNSKDFVSDYYDAKSKTVKQLYNGIMIPNLSYKIEF